MRKNVYIAIEGVIGVGKTTLTRLAQNEFHAEILLEVFEENPFLARFYQDRKRYGFQTQIFFLLSRYHQQHEVIPAALTRGNLISDYTFDKNAIFARLNIAGDELTMYERVHTIIATKIPTPDLVVYLRADTNALMERITQRDRAYERAMERDYIAALGNAYDDFFEHYTAAPVLTIDTNDLDFVRRPEDLRSILDHIRAKLESGAFQKPLFDKGGGG
ncbi:MAG: deoxynucleoside kinase [Anaerolineales bacterium]|nr:deoxynucleoside kinase [Anaerolineales bacterium]